MKTPKTTKGLLKLLLKIADIDLDLLKDADKESFKRIKMVIGNIQNEFNEEDCLAPLLRKYNLTWKG